MRYILASLLLTFSSTQLVAQTERQVYPDPCSHGAGAISQQECLKARQKQSAAIRTQATASPQLLQFQEQMRPVWFNVRLAMSANMCGLRSDRYFETFKDAAIIYSMKQRATDRFTGAEVDAIDLISTSILYSNKITCNDLVRDGWLPKLDRIYDEITGGYR